MSDELAQRLADLQVKRNRTLADLDAIQEAARSMRRSLDSFAATQNDAIQPYFQKLDEDLADDERRTVFEHLDQAFRSGVDEFHDLIAEWERLQVQERILFQMIIELDRQIEDVSREMA